MATNKKSFIAYCNWKDTFEALTDEYAGKLIKHIFSYVTDENPISDDMIINASFAQIKSTLKSDLKKYEETFKDKSEGGFIGNLKRWHPDLVEKYINEKLTKNQIQLIISDRKKSETEIKTSDTDNVRSDDDRIQSDVIDDIVIDIDILNNNIVEIYKAYPTKCPIKGSSTGKSNKDKDKIKTLLKTYDKDYLLKVIDFYLSDCKKHNIFIKNFSTFLNNLPELPDITQEIFNTSTYLDKGISNLSEEEKKFLFEACNNIPVKERTQREDDFIFKYNFEKNYNANNS